MYQKSGKALLAAIILLSTFFGVRTALAQTKNVDQIIAWVNNGIILKSEYDTRLAQIRTELADPQGKAALKGAQLEQAVNEQNKRLMESMIDDTLLLQKASDLGLAADVEIVKTKDQLRQQYKLPTIEALEAEISKQMSLSDFEQNIRVKYLRDQVLSREVYGRVVVTNEDMRKYYDAHVKDFDRPACVRLREIEVITENRGPEETVTQQKKLEEALAAVKKGTDFAEVAAKYSESENAQEGGDAGFYAKGELQPALEDIVSKLEKGQVSDIIPVKGALMVVKLEDKHNGGILPYELAQREIQNILWQQGVQPKIRDYLIKLRTDGFIKVAEGYTDTGASDKTQKVAEVNKPADVSPVIEKDGKEDAKPAKPRKRRWPLN